MRKPCYFYYLRFAMKWNPQEKTQIKIALGSVGIVNVLWLLATSKYGLALSADSANYLSVAENLSKGLGFVQFDGFPFYNTPPLYPIILSLGYLLGIPILVFAKIINLLAFNISYYFVYKLQKNYLKNAFQGLSLALIACSYWVFSLAFLYCLSEAVFIALLSGFLYFFLVRPTPNAIWVSAALLALLCLDRYAGFMLLPAIFLMQLLHKEKLKQITILFLPTLLFSLCWFIRNDWVSGNILGDHQINNKINPLVFLENVMIVFQTVVHKPIQLIILLLLMFAYMGACLLLRSKTQSEQEIQKVGIWLFFLCSSYLILLLVQRNLQISQLPRYLTIIWIPASLLIPIILQKLYKINYLTILQAQLILLLLAGIQLFLISMKTVKAYQNGAGGMNEISWQDEPMKHYLNTRLPDKKMISNFPDYLWLTTHKCVNYALFLNENKTAYFIKNKDVNYCIWFRDRSREHLMAPLDSILQIHQLKLLDQQEKFCVYERK